jgi:hypothetical protein
MEAPCYTLRRVAFVPPSERFFSQATPLGKLPVIEDGDVTIGESGAIVEYVVEHQPPRAEPGLERTGPPGRHPDRCGVLGRLAYRVRLDAPAIDGWGSLPPHPSIPSGLARPDQAAPTRRPQTHDVAEPHGLERWAMLGGAGASRPAADGPSQVSDRRHAAPLVRPIHSGGPRTQRVSGTLAAPSEPRRCNRMRTMKRTDIDESFSARKAEHE